MENSYKRTVAGSIGAGMASVFNASGRQYYILEHKTESKYHNLGESQKIIVDQVELGRDAGCQVRFDESMDTVSRRHAAIVKDGEGWKIINLSTTNSTYVNGQPITEWKLSSGDEIRLSSHGPVMGFIVPQGKQSMVSSIGLTERMNLFRKQALRPYKTALIILSVVLVLAVGGLIAWNVAENNRHREEVQKLEYSLQNVSNQIEAKDAEIQAMEKTIMMNKDAASTETKKLNEQLSRLREDKLALEKERARVAKELNDVSKKVNDLAAPKEEPEVKPEPKPEKPEEAIKAAEPSAEAVQDAIRQLQDKNNMGIE